MAKAFCWAVTDIERRKLREQIGLDTLVVLAVNDAHYVLYCRTKANALSAPPGEYTRKGETQRN